MENAKYEVLPSHLPGGNTEIHKNLHHHNKGPGHDLKQIPPKYKKDNFTSYADFFWYTLNNLLQKS
jgi:hypothetical protein